jgi:transcriptional regulator with XRE-family HTH domain
VSPLGKIILARAAVLGGQRGAGIPAKDLSLSEMSALTGGRLTRAAISEWILGRVKNPTPQLLADLANALSDRDYPKMELLNDMRAAVGMPQETTARAVDVADLCEADVEVLQTIANRLRQKGREAAQQAHAATDRASGFAARPQASGRHNGDAAAVVG